VPHLNDMFHEQNATAVAPGPASAGPGSGTFDASRVMARLAGRVLGQEPALNAVHRALLPVQAGVHDRERPLASLLLVGPTGVGKTELVRRLAAELRGGPDDLCRVDMSQLAQEHYAASFAGAPPGYAGSREGLSVFDRDKVEGGPLTPGIVLFDEVEKAHSTVLRALLGVLDRGTLRLANGQQSISFRNAFVFLTSNLGSRELARYRSATWRTALDRALAVPGAGALARATRRLSVRAQERIMDRAVRGFFDPEFLNRLDEVVPFAEIDPVTARAITRLEVGFVADRLHHRGAELSVDEAAIGLLCRQGFDPVHGARSVRRVVHRRVLVPSAAALVEQRAAGRPHPRIRITCNGEDIALAVSQ
jgi:ATP-dependent Clp protease ATP-binding subunit ClpA